MRLWITWRLWNSLQNCLQSARIMVICVGLDEVAAVKHTSFSAHSTVYRGNIILSTILIEANIGVLLFSMASRYYVL